MLAQKQSKARYLYNAFYETECCECLAITVIVVPILIFCYFWFQVNMRYFEEKDVVFFMIVEGFLFFIVGSSIVGFIEIVIQKYKTPDKSICTLFNDNISLFTGVIALVAGGIILALIFGFVKFIYFINITVILYNYGTPTNFTELKGIEKSAEQYTFIEIFIIPF